MSVNIELSSTVIAAVVAHLAAAVSGILLYRQAHNWRIRFISVVVGLVPVYQAIRLVRESEGWPTVGSGALPEMAELAVAAMFLCCVLALKKESSTREQTEKRLRLAEGAAGWSTQGKPEDGLDKLIQWNGRRQGRRCLHCNRPIRGLRRWTTRSPFCSDQHREAYYSQYAVPRLERLAAAVGGKPAVSVETPVSTDPS